MYELFSGLSIQFHLSVGLFLWQYCAVLVTISLCYALKSDITIPPSLFFVVQDCFGCLDLWASKQTSEIFSISVKNIIAFL
jgi:hypothetical protein